MRLTKRIIFILFFCLFFASIFAQNKFVLSGTVKDVKGNPVLRATVAIENTTLGTLTDGKGRYSFQLPNGKQTLIVSALGYNTIRKEMEIRQSTTFDFVLEENAISLDEVHIFGKTNTQRIQEKGYSGINLDILPLAASLSNLNTLVNRTSGIRIREEGGVGSDFNLSINGLSGNAVRYFVDGVPLSAMGSGVSLNNLPVNMVERIEIYKGVVPAELGEDALGGAVNVITRRNRSKYIDVSVGAGSFHTYKADFSAQYIHSETGFTIRPSFGLNASKNDYTMRDVEVWDAEAREYRPKNMKRFHDGFQSAFGRLEAGFLNRKWANEAFVEATLSTQKKELQTGQKQTIVIGDAFREVTSASLSARYVKNNFLIDRLTARAFFSYTADHTQVTDTAYRAYAWDGSWVATSFSEVTGRGKSIRRYERPQTVIRANFNYIVDENRSLNLNYLMNSVGNKRTDDFDGEFIPTNDHLDKHVIGLSYNRKLWNDRFHTSLFVKDYIFRAELKQQDLYWITGINDVPPTATQNNVGYGASGRFTIVPALSLKGSYERSVRLPVSREFLGNGETIYPNFKLKPETAHNVNIGAFGEYLFDTPHKVNYETNLFVRKVQDYILRLPISDRQSQYSNVAAATVKGIEGEISYEYKDLFRVLANATYLDERDKNPLLPNGKTNITYNNRMPNRPWTYANVQLYWNAKNPFGVKDSRLRLNYAFRYIQWFYLTWEAYGNQTTKEIIPSQFVNDAVVTWAFHKDRYSLSLECSNIFDRKLYDNYMLQKPGRAFFGKFRIFIH